MAKITLVRPHVIVAVSSPVSPTCPPIGLAYIASSLRVAGHDVYVIDAVGEAPAQFVKTQDPRFLVQGLSLQEILDRINIDTEAVGVSCMFSYEWPNVRNLIKALRNKLPTARIILGGEHASSLSEFCLRDCSALDIAASGEGEEIMLELSDISCDLSKVNGITYRNGDAIVQNPARKRIKAIDDIPKPAWELFPLENYLGRGYGRGANRGRNMPLISSRGCPYKCTFCSNHTMWGSHWASRSPALVVDEIKEYVEKYKITNFDFYDLTTIVNRKWTINFCKLLIDSGMKFTWQLASGTRSEAIDEEVSEFLAKSGCANISYAPESGSKSVLGRIKKKVDLKKLKSSMRSSEKNGIICKANILIGFPGETHFEILQTLKFCIEAAFTGIHDLSVYPFSPYPGSALFNQLRAENRIPEINDAYFYSLALSTELGAKAPSFSEHISTKALAVYRILGIALFYGISFLLHPWRIYSTIKNIFGETQETLLESALHDRWVRKGKFKKNLEQ